MGPLDPTTLWHAISASRFGVVDDFELDGRRFLTLEPRLDSVARIRPSARRLSRRETQVLAAVAMGHANKHIAYDLGISESTVSAYVRRASKKLHATSRVGLVRAWQRMQSAPMVAPRAA